MLAIDGNVQIPFTELDFSFSRSSGPGGQNVNKVNTKVTLHWDVVQSPALSESLRQRFCKKFHRRINKRGQLVISSQRYRDQGRNVADCIEKLRNLIAEVAVVPRTRKTTRPTRASRERRLKNKKAKSQKKQQRKQPRSED